MAATHPQGDLTDADLAPLTTSTLIAHHQGAQGGFGNLPLLFVFLGVLATAGWLIFSTMQWRHTVTVTVTGWAVLLGLTFGW